MGGEPRRVPAVAGWLNLVISTCWIADIECETYSRPESGIFDLQGGRVSIIRHSLISVGLMRSFAQRNYELKRSSRCLR
jgi:hypothetical protein